MPRVHSHYENLKVARDAPQEVIRAAYRSLSRKYHPDRNPGNADAERIMSMINAAYDVLSDPSRKREHDEWIAHAEGRGASQRRPFSPTSSASAGPRRSAAFAVDEEELIRPRLSRTQQLRKHVAGSWYWYGLAIGLITVGIASQNSATPPLGLGPFGMTPEMPRLVRPTAAPNGRPWPLSSGYVDGYPVLHTTGLSEVTVDNSLNDADVFVKLVSLDGPQAYPVRVFFIRANDSLTLAGLTAGTYDLRHRDLGDGGLSRSQSFDLSEAPTTNGTRNGTTTIRLYKVKDGNMKSFALAEAEF